MRAHAIWHRKVYIYNYKYDSDSECLARKGYVSLPCVDNAYKILLSVTWLGGWITSQSYYNTILHFQELLGTKQTLSKLHPNNNIPFNKKNFFFIIHIISRKSFHFTFNHPLQPKQCIVWKPSGHFNQSYGNLQLPSFSFFLLKHLIFPN